MEVLVAKGEFPLDFQKIINLDIEIEGLQDGIKRLELLEAELF